MTIDPVHNAALIDKAAPEDTGTNDSAGNDVAMKDITATYVPYIYSI